MKAAFPVRAELVLLAAFALITVGLVRVTFDRVDALLMAQTAENEKLHAQLMALQTRMVFVQADNEILRKLAVSESDAATIRHQVLFDAVLDVKRDLTNLQAIYRPSRR